MKKLAAISLTALALCTASAFASTPTKTPTDGYPAFALGADVSWTPYIEANHLHTYYKGEVVAANQVTTIDEMVSDHGIDAVRLRVWVNPCNELVLAGFSFSVDGYKYDEMSTFGTCTVEEMTTLAKRFANRGQRIMVCFQMSDTWADPAHQFIPKDWADSKSVEELAQHASDHVDKVLTILHNANVNVAWVQIGNEVNNGMLEWNLPAKSGDAVTVAPHGCQIAQVSSSQPTPTTANFVTVFRACSATAKSIYPLAKTVLHLTHGAKWETLNWTMRMLTLAGFTPQDCDYLGISLYPGDDDGTKDYTAKWKNSADNCLTTIKNLYDTYSLRTLLCEIGMNNEYSASTPQSEIDKLGLQRAGINQCNADVRAFTEYLIQNLATTESTCDGLFYWEPETDYMKDYTKGACVSVNPGPSWPRDKVTANDWWKVVNENSTFPAGGLTDFTLNSTEGIESIYIDGSPRYYDLNGIEVSAPSRPGIYIRRTSTLPPTKIVIR